LTKDPLTRLRQQLTLLPGIGERTALRLALHVLQQRKEQVIALAECLMEVVDKVLECRICCNLTTASDLCVICQKPNRDPTMVAIISSIEDLMAIESSMSFRGSYHVLHGVLQPVQGIGPDKLRFKQLFDRLATPGELNELILATPATIEGEATALFIHEQLKGTHYRVSRIATGVPVGGDLQFADRVSLARAFMMRQKL
jgi:recombination protein RecR